MYDLPGTAVRVYRQCSTIIAQQQAGLTPTSSSSTVDLASSAALNPSAMGVGCQVSATKGTCERTSGSWCSLLFNGEARHLSNHCPSINPPFLDPVEFLSKSKLGSVVCPIQQSRQSRTQSVLVPGIAGQPDCTSDVRGGGSVSEWENENITLGGTEGLPRYGIFQITTYNSTLQKLLLCSRRQEHLD